MYHDGFYAHHGGPGFFAWFCMVVLTLLLIALVAAAVSQLGGMRLRGQTRPAPDDPLQVVRMRYARGELDRDAFLRANEDLGGPAPPPAHAP